MGHDIWQQFSGKGNRTLQEPLADGWEELFCKAGVFTKEECLPSTWRALASKLSASYKKEIINVRYLHQRNQRKDTEVHPCDSVLWRADSLSS